MSLTLSGRATGHVRSIPARNKTRLLCKITLSVALSPGGKRTFAARADLVAAAGPRDVQEESPFRPGQGPQALAKMRAGGHAQAGGDLLAGESLVGQGPEDGRLLGVAQDRRRRGQDAEVRRVELDRAPEVTLPEIVLVDDHEFERAAGVPVGEPVHVRGGADPGGEVDSGHGEFPTLRLGRCILEYLPQ